MLRRANSIAIITISSVQPLFLCVSVVNPLPAGFDPASGNQRGMSDELGMVIKGSLSDGLEMKLADGRSVEEVRAGRFVVGHGERLRFFSVITNVALQASNPRILANPPGPEDTLHRQVLAGSGTYGTVELRPMLMLNSSAD